MTDYEKKMFDGLAAGAAFLAISIQYDGDKVPKKWLKFLALWEKKLEAIGADKDETLFNFIDTAIDSYNEFYGETA